MAGLPKLLFVDANIWLDFYRARTDAALALLRHLEKVSDRIIVTHQLEMEFKKNRQSAIAESLQELKSPQHVPRTRRRRRPCTPDSGLRMPASGS